MKELENLPTPSNEKDEKYLQNLVRLDSIIKVLTEKGKQGKLDCVLVERITKAAFPDTNHRDYNRGRGKGRTPLAKVDIGKAGTSAQAEAGTSAQVDIGKAGPSTQADKSDV